MNKPILEISLPEYNLKQKPDYESIGKKIDEVLIKIFLGQDVALRCLSLQDHREKSLDQLIEIIEQTGTDKYDPERKMSVAHDFYAEKGVKLFASPIKITEDMQIMNEVIKDFYEGALHDRGYSLKIDLIVVYDLSKLQEIPIHYDDGIGKDAFTFKYPENKDNAVLGFIKLIDN